MDRVDQDHVAYPTDSEKCLILMREDCQAWVRPNGELEWGDLYYKKFWEEKKRKEKKTQKLQAIALGINLLHY